MANVMKMRDEDSVISSIVRKSKNKERVVNRSAQRALKHDRWNDYVFDSTINNSNRRVKDYV